MDYNEEINRLKDDNAEIKAMLRQIVNKKPLTKIAYDAAKKAFWNWSFVLGVILGVSIIYPFADGESKIGFRLPNIIKWLTPNPSPNPNPSPDPPPNPNPNNLKSLAPQAELNKLPSLSTRLKNVLSTLQLGGYQTPLTAQAEIAECLAPFNGVPTWVGFLDEIDARTAKCSKLSELETVIDTIIKEIQ